MTVIEVVTVSSAIDIIEPTATLIEIADLVTGGSGDVNGPAVSVDDNLVTFDSTTGKIIQDSGINISAVIANTAKVTNVSTSLSVGTVGANTVAITSDGGADDVTLPAATIAAAGMLTTAKWAEIVANNAKVSFDWDYDYDDLINKPTIPTAIGDLSGDMDDITDGSTYVKTHNDLTDTLAGNISTNNAKVTNVSTNLSEGTSTTTTVDVNSSDGTNATLVSASTTRAGLLTKAKWDEIVANTAKDTNATHTGEVTGSGVLTVDKTAITGKSAVTAVGADYILISDTGDSGNLKKALISDISGSGGYTNLTEFVDQTAWRVFYSNTDGDVTELALGADGTFLKSNGATSAPTFATPAGSGDVSKVGTPVDNQVGVWTGDGTIEGTTDFTIDSAGVDFFEGTDVGDGVDGKHLTVHRKAAEGDKYMSLYINNSMNDAYIATDAVNMRFTAGGGNIYYGSDLNPLTNIQLGRYSNNNRVMNHYGYLTAETSEKYVQWVVDDTDDKFHLTRQDATIGGFKIEMPVEMTGTLDVTGNITTDGTVDGIDIATDVAANTLKVTNVSTALSVGTVGANTVAITSDGGADDVTLPAATVATAGMLTTAKWAEIVANNAKVTTKTDLTQFTEQTAWRVFYSNTDGDVTELALGADGTFLKSNGAAVAPTFATPAGSGDVSKVGTPVDNQVGVWTGDGTLEGVSSLTYDGTSLKSTATPSTYADSGVITNWLTVNTANGAAGGSASLFLDNNNGQVYEFYCAVGGSFGVYDKTNTAARMDITSSGVVTFEGNLNANDGLDVTGNITVTGTVDGIDIATDVAANTLKVTNVSTNLSEGTSTTTTVDVNSSDGTNATLVSASTTRAGLLTKAKWDEIVANTAKTGVTTQISNVSEDSSPSLGGNLVGGAHDISVNSGQKFILDGSGGNSYFTYNSSTSKVELYVDGVKKYAWG